MDRVDELRALLHSGPGPLFIHARVDADDQKRIIPSRDGYGIKQRFMQASAKQGLRPGLSGVQSGLCTPENFTTLAHFSVSFATSLPNSAGVPGISFVPPKARQAARLIWGRRESH